MDYRKLNTYKKDVHPLSWVEGLLDALEGSCIFSTTDLQSGCWQVWNPVTGNRLHLLLQMDYGKLVGCSLVSIMVVQPSKELLKSFYHTCLSYFNDLIIQSSNLQELVSCFDFSNAICELKHLNILLGLWKLFLGVLSLLKIFTRA